MKRVLQFAIAVFPKSPAFIKPSKRALHNPTFWQYSKRVKFITLDNLNICARKVLDGVGEIFSGVASICQNLFQLGQVVRYEAPKPFDQLLKDAADPNLPHSYEWYMIENIDDPDKRIDHILPLDEAIPLYADLNCGDKRLGVTKDDIAAVDLAIRWNGREWLSEDRLKEDSFKHDPRLRPAPTDAGSCAGRRRRKSLGSRRMTTTYRLYARRDQEGTPYRI